MATTDGSDSTMPRPRTYTSVLAVPRSTAISRPPNPVSELKIPIERPLEKPLQLRPNQGSAV
jgi:hypothetical protein